MGKRESGRGATIKRTYLLPVELVERLEAVAERERRPIGRQLEIFLEAALAKDEREQKQAETEPGNRMLAPRKSLNLAA
jgi:hypothetical protein